MRRRDFLALVGSAAIWPLAVRAQQPTVGFLNSASPDRFAPYVAAFLEGLREAGYVEGRNVALEYRWAEDREDRIPALAADLVQRGVAVIAGVNTTAAVRAVKGVTTTVPVVFNIGGDPVKFGLVDSFNRPGGNITGVSYTTNVLGPKRLELLKEVVPNLVAIAVLVNPNNPNAKGDVDDIAAAATSFGLSVRAIELTAGINLEAAFETLVRQRVGALMIAPDPLLIGLRPQILALATRHSLPGVFTTREWAVAGGLISFGPSLADSYRQCGIYTGRILDGEKPAELPILQPTQFELALNLRTAQALGLTIPPALLARADEVFE